MFASLKGMFRSRKDKANEAVLKAQEKTRAIEEKLRAEISKADIQISLLQSRLAQDLNSNAPRSQVIDITKRIKQNQKIKRLAQGKLANIHKESQQLTDATINLDVIETMNESLQAQRMLTQAVSDKDIDDVDDLLDDIEEKRCDTNELGERLGSLGLDDDDTFEDETIDESEIIEALGWATKQEDQKYFEAVKHKIEFTQDMCKMYATPPKPVAPLREESFPDVPQPIQPRQSHVQENRTGWNF